MLKLFSKNFWDVLARLILRNKIGILISVVIITVLLSTQWKHMRFTYTEANLLPDEHEVNLTYNDFLEVFGEEGNLVILGIKDDKLYSVETLNAWKIILVLLL
jgi:predicted RND superfamily exporter protein